MVGGRVIHLVPGVDWNQGVRGGGETMDGLVYVVEVVE